MNPATRYLVPDSHLRLCNAASDMLTQRNCDLGTVMALFHAALELDPNEPRTLMSFCVALDRIPGSAEQMRDISLRIFELLAARGEPVPPELLLNYSLALHKCYDTTAALLNAQAALSAAEITGLSKDLLVHYWTNMANALIRVDRVAEAIPWLTRVIECPLSPILARLQAVMARGSLYLQLSDWERAWPDIQRRFEFYSFTGGWLGHPDIRNATNRWDGDGELLRGKRLLVYLEQGLGDQIQHARNVQWMAKAFHPASITVACDPKLQALMRTLDGVFPATIPDANPIPNAADYDYLVPALSLMAERWRHGLHPMGEPARGYLSGAIAHGRRPGPFRVGIYWQGSPQNTVDWARSCPLEHFYALAYEMRERGLEIEWHAFQPYNKATPQGVWDGWDLSDIPLVDHWADSPDKCGMEWTVPQLEDLDLFLGVESGQMHLCLAATRVPCILVHTHAMDFRWFHAGNLYGGAERQVYHHRQTTPGDWAKLFSSLIGPIRAMAEPILARSGFPLPANSAPPQGGGNLNTPMKGENVWQ